jgi:Lipase (class 3)
VIPSNADLAVMVLCAGDADTIFGQPNVSAGGNPGLPAPTDKLIAYLTSDKWLAIAQLRADDLFITKGQNVYYGLVLRCLEAVGPFVPGDHLVAVRGTMNPLEWANDACGEFLIATPSSHGLVGSGFWNVYGSMTANLMTGGPFEGTAASAIGVMVKGVGGQVYVVGHSLGAVLATYLAADLVAEGVDVTPAFFASPKPGSSDFADAYQQRVPAFSLVDFEADLVPMLPSSPPSVALKAGGPTQNVHILKRGSPGSPGGLDLSPVTNHDPATYAAMLRAL